MWNARLARSVSESVNASPPYNASPPKQYAFTPAGPYVKLTLCSLIGLAGVISFLGNLTVFRFVGRKEKERPRTARPSNLNHFISSLAVSDILGSLIGVPLVIVNWSVDVFQTGWPCNVARLIVFFFPSVTVYILMVISLERYILICRPTSRPLSRAAVEKLVKGAWGLALLVALAGAYSVAGIRVEVDETRYTVVCKVDNNTPLKAVFSQTAAVLVYPVPLVFIVVTTACVLRSVWKKKFITGPASAGGVERRHKQRKATILLLVIIAAFIVPYALLIGYTFYKFHMARRHTNFTTDFMMRCVGALLVFMNGAINFLIHLFQLPGFRGSLKARIVRNSAGQDENGTRPTSQPQDPTPNKPRIVQPDSNEIGPGTGPKDYIPTSDMSFNNDSGEEEGGRSANLPPSANSLRGIPQKNDETNA